MSKIYVCEVVDVAQMSQSDSTPILPAPSSVEYTVIVSAGVSGAAQPFQPATRFIEVSTDTTCSIAIGQFPGTVGTGTAVLTNRRLQTNERITLRVPFYPQNTSPQGSQSGNYVPYCIFTTANV
jgi:hypothetical protein